MKYSVLLFLSLLIIIGCSKENPVEPARPSDVRLKVEYTTGILDGPNGVFGVWLTLEDRNDIDSVEVRIYQHLPIEYGLWRRPYSKSLVVKNSQPTIDSAIVIGNPSTWTPGSVSWSLRVPTAERF